MVEIAGVEALAAQLGLDPDELRAHPASLAEDGKPFAPWPVTMLVANVTQ